MSEHTEKLGSRYRAELDLLPPCPWSGRSPEPPPGAPADANGAQRSGSRSTGDQVDQPAVSISARRICRIMCIAATGSPLEHAARFAMQPLAAIAREIGGSRLDAWAWNRQAALEFLARYVIPQQPKPVLVAARGE